MLRRKADLNSESVAIGSAIRCACLLFSSNRLCRLAMSSFPCVRLLIEGDEEEQVAGDADDA